MPTKTRIIKIGNSRGIRVPKIVQATRRPRTGWAKAARAMRDRAHDGLLDEPIATNFDREEWEWKWRGVVACEWIKEKLRRA